MVSPMKTARVDPMPDFGGLRADCLKKSTTELLNSTVLYIKPGRSTLVAPPGKSQNDGLVLLTVMDSVGESKA